MPTPTLKEASQDMVRDFLRRPSVLLAALLLGAFVSGFFVHLLYGRWTGPLPCAERLPGVSASATDSSARGDLPVVDVMEVERLQELAGVMARVRGRVHRVGHSSKSNTYFLDFGPSRSAFTAVIFSSAADAFLRENAHPNQFQGQEVELTGRIKDDPKYGLEMILEGPAQIKVQP